MNVEQIRLAALLRGHRPPSFCGPEERGEFLSHTTFDDVITHANMDEFNYAFLEWRDASPLAKDVKAAVLRVIYDDAEEALWQAHLIKLYEAMQEEA